MFRTAKRDAVLRTIKDADRLQSTMTEQARQLFDEAFYPGQTKIHYPRFSLNIGAVIKQIMNAKLVRALDRGNTEGNLTHRIDWRPGGGQARVARRVKWQKKRPLSISQLAETLWHEGVHSVTAVSLRIKKQWHEFSMNRLVRNFDHVAMREFYPRSEWNRAGLAYVPREEEQEKDFEILEKDVVPYRKRKREEKRDGVEGIAAHVVRKTREANSTKEERPHIRFRRMLQLTVRRVIQYNKSLREGIKRQLLGTTKEGDSWHWKQYTKRPPPIVTGIEGYLAGTINRLGIRLRDPHDTSKIVQEYTPHVYRYAYRTRGRKPPHKVFRKVIEYDIGGVIASNLAKWYKGTIKSTPPLLRYRKRFPGGGEPEWGWWVSWVDWLQRDRWRSEFGGNMHHSLITDRP